MSDSQRGHARGNRPSHEQGSPFQGLYLVLGRDAKARQRRVDTLASSLAEKGTPYDRIVLDGEDVTAETVSEAVQTTPLFPNPRFVWLKHMEKARTELLEHLAEVLPPKSPQTMVVLSAASLDRRLKPVQRLQRMATVIVVDPPAPKDVPRWIMEQAAVLGLRMSRQAADVLQALVGDDTMALSTELEKLALTVPPGTVVDGALVESMASRALPWAAEYAVFQLVDAVVEGRRGEAYRILRQLKTAGKPPLLILHMLARQYRLLVAACGRPDLRPEELAREMDIKNYPARKVVGQARSMTFSRAFAGLEAILDADGRMKTSSGEDMLTLEMLIGRLTA